MCRLTIFTCSVYRDVTRLWYAVLQKTVLAGLTEVDVLVYDCGSMLDPTQFPGVRIIRHPNREHGRKIDHAMRRHIRSDLSLILDDDVFPLDPQPLVEGVARMEADTNVAAYSFMPRDHWEIEAHGQEHSPMGSYAVIVRPALLRAAGMTARNVRTDDPAIRRGAGYFDTLDFANWTWLQDGREVLLAPEEARRAFPTFLGTSSGYMTFSHKRFLRYFRRRYAMPRDEFWKLVRAPYTFQRACAVAAVSELHRETFGQEPSFTNIPSLEELQCLPGRSFSGEQLRAARGALRRTERVVAKLKAVLMSEEQ